MSEFLIDNLPLWKALHLIGMVAWFGGMFYLGRIFVYHSEAFDLPKDKSAVLIPQYELMQNRVYKIIFTPAMVITWIFGLLMLHIYGVDWLKANYWMHAKLLLLVLLSGYHGYCKTVMKKLAKGEKVMSSFKFRLFNEVPTIFLVAIILLAVFRNTLDFGKAFGGIILFAIVLVLFTKWYKKLREQKN